MRRVRHRAQRLHRRPSADREREFIRRRIAEGKDEGARSRPRWSTEYGPERARPPPEGGGFDVAAWLVPGARSPLLGAGRASALAALRWRGTARRVTTTSPRRGGRELDPDDARRLDARPGGATTCDRRRAASTPRSLAAFAVGFVSFISPCVLPLVPGLPVAPSPASRWPRSRTGDDRLRRVLLPAAVFCLTFTVVFVALGMTATGIGSALQRRPRHARARSPARVIIALGVFFLLTPFVDQAQPRVAARRADARAPARAAR